MARGRRSKAGYTCPRCGSLGHLTVREVSGREYYYVRHYRENSERECYLGPVYGYVVCLDTWVLKLRSIVDGARFLSYIRNASGHIERSMASLSVKELSALREEFIRLHEWIERMIEDIELMLSVSVDDGGVRNGGAEG